MRIVEKIKNILMILVIVFVIVPILFLSSVILIDSFRNPNEVPSFFGWKPFIVLSNSMKPIIESGDLILIKEITDEAIRKGDIIAYLENDIIITHRVVSIEENDGEISYVVKGDKNEQVDEALVALDKIEGIYQFKISGLGDVLFFLQTTNGVIFCLSIPCILLFIIQFRNNDEKEIVSK